MRLLMLVISLLSGLVSAAGPISEPAMTPPDATKIPPKFIEGARPTYPDSLRRSGNDGVVVARLLVTESGTVSSIEILESSHPDFEKAAVEALPTWRFSPATRDGRPVTTWAEQRVVFSLRGSLGSMIDPGVVRPYAVNDPARQAQGDRPVAVKVATPVAYPLDLLLADQRGSATIEFFVNPQGLVVEARVLSATHPAFGAAAKAAMESWQFDPARQAGEPSWAKVQRKVRFDIAERDMQLDASAVRIVKLLKRNPERIVPLAVLDAMPAALYQPGPVYPPDRRGVTGTVKVEFIIDHEGRAQLPKAVEYRDEALAWAAVTAVQRWRFEIPRQAGKPVDALARIPVEFSLKE